MTNCSPELLTWKEVVVLYRTRWQIEIFLAVTEFGGDEHRYPPRDAEINRFWSQHSWERCRFSRSAGQRQSWFFGVVAGCQGAKFHNNAQARQCSRHARREPCRCCPWSK